MSLRSTNSLELGELEHARRAGAPASRRAEAHHHAVERDVLARGQLGVEAHPELDEGGQPAGHADRARVGAVDLTTGSSSSVLLPDPLRPTIPKNSPRRTSNDTPRNARNSRYSRAAQRVGDALLERVDALRRDPEGLLHAAHLDHHRAKPRPSSRASDRCSIRQVAPTRRTTVPSRGGARALDRADDRLRCSMTSPEIYAALRRAGHPARGRARLEVFASRRPGRSSAATT